MPLERMDNEMGEKKPTKNTGSNIAAGVAMAASIVPLVKPAIDAIRDYTDRTIEERKKLVAVPELYSKEYPLTVEQAVEILESCGLKATLVKMSLADADAQYRQCFNSQVIKSHPKSKTKVERGTAVLIKYISQEVIDESQQIFDISEKHKEEQYLEKNIKRTERKAKTKQVVSGIVGTIQESAKKIPPAFHKFTKKEGCNEQE